MVFHGMVHRIRLDDEEVKMIAKGLRLLAQKLGSDKSVDWVEQRRVVPSTNALIDEKQESSDLGRE